MDPFFEDVPLGLRIIDPVQIHTNGDINCSYRGKLCNLFVVLKECHRYSVKEVKCIQHSNLLMCMGTTSHKDFKIWEGYDCNLVEFLQKIESHRRRDFFVVDFLSQIVDGLVGLHKRESAHGDLVPENIVIQIDPPMDSQDTNFILKLNDANTEFIVKLKDYDTSKAGEKDFLKDLKFFGRILELFLDESQEASDLLCRIQGTWENVNMVSVRQGQYLSDLFRTQYLLSPIRIRDHPRFWPSLKVLEFFSVVDEFLTVYYEETKPLSESVKEFVKELKKLEVDKDWTKDIHETVYKKALRARKALEDQKTSIGILKCIRNVHTHYVAYLKEAKDTIGKKDCYEYFRIKYPGLLIHTYRCLELHYGNMRRLNAIDAGCDDTFMPFIPSVILSS